MNRKSKNRSSRLIAIDLVLVLLITIGLYPHAISGFEWSEGFFGHEAPYIVTFIACFLVSFGLTRKRRGCYTLFALGSVFCAGAAFLGFPVRPGAFLLFLISVLLDMGIKSIGGIEENRNKKEEKPDNSGPDSAGKDESFRDKNGRKKTNKETEKEKSFIEKTGLNVVMQIAVMVLITFLLSSSVYFCIVKQIQPPTKELELIVKLESMDVMDRLGVYTPKHILDSDLASELPEDDDEKTEDDEEEIPDDSELNDLLEKNKDFVIKADAIRYDMDFSDFPWEKLAAAFLAVAFILWWCIGHRKRWYKKVIALDNESIAVNLFAYMLRRLSKKGFGRAEEMSAAAYGLNIAGTIPELRGLEKLAELYEGIIYGGCKLTDSEAELFKAMYANLKTNLKGVRRHG